MSDPTLGTTLSDAPAPTPTPTLPDSIGIKSGWKSSETWIKIGALVLSAAFGAGLIPTSGTTQQLATMAVLLFGSLGYTISRTRLKIAAINAMSTVRRT